MIAWTFLIAMAVAAPDPPGVFSSAPDECAESIPVVAGEMFPALDAHTLAATCSGILVPSTQIANLLAVETWAWELKAYNEAALARARVEIAIAQEQTDRAKRNTRVMAIIAAVASASAGTMAVIAF